MTNSSQLFIEALRSATPRGRVLTSSQATLRYRSGIKVGGGDACAVVQPASLLEFWQSLKVCTEFNKIVICQAANTGLTGGSTPDGNEYDRDVVIISNIKLDKLTLLNGGAQVLAWAGTSLYRLEDILRPIGRGPHSVIGSSCIGASVVGGICNNSGGNLVNRGPAYTELSLFAQLDSEGELSLVNHLNINLGDSPEDILTNLQDGNFEANQTDPSPGVASDNEYQRRVREIDKSTPARFNADKRRLHESSGCAGKLAVFAVIVDTFNKPTTEKVFYIGTNKPSQLSHLRKRILTEFDELPEMGEYMHRSYFDGADKYCKDSFLFIKYLGSAFLPKLFAIKSWVDGTMNKLSFIPKSFSDRTLQRLARIWPDHLPKRMREYRNRYEHHLMIVANDEVIESTRALLSEELGVDGTSESGKKDKGDYFECTDSEGLAAQIHRFVAGGASGRYAIVHDEECGGLMPFDIALPRNCDDWHCLLPPDVLDQLAAPYSLGHFFCQVIHWDFVVKEGVEIEPLKARILAILDEHGAKYPAEHNVGHLYEAEPDLANFYQSLDPTNSFNSGVGKMSKLKNYKAA